MHTHTGLWSGMVLVTLSGGGVGENSLPFLWRGGLGGGAASGVLVTLSGGVVRHNTRVGQLGLGKFS